jgi:hypothetical protein
MKIPLRELEEARRNPDAYLRKRRSSGGFNFNPKSKYRTLVRSINTFHRNGNDSMFAQDYLEVNFAKQFKEQKQLAHYIEILGQYILDFKDSGATVFRVKDILVVPLAPEFTDAGFHISGEIPRLDITADGYTAWLFSNKQVDWENEIRLPLIQSAYAEILNVDEQEVNVNIYDFVANEHKSFRFSEPELKDSKTELHRTLNLIQNLEKLNK